jgi:ssDNA-binding Zn-finger/Zn-ribbon topoisomerase 1
MYKEGLREKSLIEDEYFYKKDRELIEKMHENEKKKADLLERTTHYHKCADCGDAMHAKAFEGLDFLQCQNCESIHLTIKSAQLASQGKRLRVLLNELEIQKQNGDNLKESA